MTMSLWLGLALILNISLCQLLYNKRLLTVESVCCQLLTCILVSPWRGYVLSCLVWSGLVGSGRDGNSGPFWLRVPILILLHRCPFGCFGSAGHPSLWLVEIPPPISGIQLSNLSLSIQCLMELDARECWSMANGFRFQFRLLNPELTVTRRRLTPNYHADVVLGSRGATKWDKIGQYRTIWDKMG